MTRKKSAYQNRSSMIMVSMIVIIIMIVVLVHSHSIKEKIAVYEAKEIHLQQQVENEEKRKEEIEEYRKYTKTKKFVEEVAKEKLGLIYEGEILFKEDK